MLRYSHKWLESLTTRYLLSTIIVSICLPAFAIFGILQTGVVKIDEVAQFIDSSLKISVVIVGALWAVNRYFVQGTDVPQLRVDVDLTTIRFDTGDKALMLYRLDIVNTGSSQIPEFEHRVKIENIYVKDGELRIAPLYLWPESGSHPGGAIEPGSWAAVNDQFLCPADVAAARVFIEVRVPAQRAWTWHKTFDVSGRADHGN